MHKFESAGKRAWSAALWCLLLVAAGELARAAEMPLRMKSLVLAAGKRPVTRVSLDGLAFDSIDPFSSGPFLLWRAERDLALPFERTHASVLAWLERSSAVLGHERIQLAFARTAMWQGQDVWVYQMLHQGIPILDASVDVHWAGGELEGVVNRMPGRIASIEDLAADRPAGRSWVYWSRRNPPLVALRLGWIEREQTAGAEITRVVTSAGTQLTRVASHPISKVPLAKFTEYVVPVGTFPDQIGVDSSGKVWFSQPNDNLITRFDPLTAGFSSVPTTGGSGPDGLWVDPLDRVWTGLYNSGDLGRYDIAIPTWRAIDMPYAPANSAIPYFSASGRVWVTDHIQNRISEWDPVLGAWTQQVIMPTPSCWVVQGSEDPARQVIYFTEYNVSKLGAKPWFGPVTDITTPGGGAAFCVYLGDRVYYSNWNTDRMGVYDVISGQIVEHTYPIAGEVGGPIAATPDGRIVVGTRNLGYIMVFDPATQQFAPYQIPTVFAGLKDGICVDAQGVIWFTETFMNKLAKLENS